MDNAHPAPFTGPAILAASGLGKTVASADGELRILDGMTFSIDRGETVAVVGASGSGKSTLLSILAGLDTPSRGTVELCGARLDLLDEDGRAAVRGAHVGFVFQSFQLLPSLTALENTLLPLEVLGRRDGADEAREWLERVGLGARLNHYPRQLSGGEQQRVAIARAFVARPDVLFADEPTGNLDSATGRKIIDLLLDIHLGQNTTLVLVTHDAALAAACQRQLEISDGRLVNDR
ncbi:MAG: ABC transporter ATP-binding protein [Porticoccaceae bacterium]